MTVEPTTKDKQITIDVPEDRVAEFYAFYGRFLAGSLRAPAPRPPPRPLRPPPPRHARRADARRHGPRGRHRLMADKQVTVAVPEERVPEFYVWFAHFLASESGGGPPWAGARPAGLRPAAAPRGRGRGREDDAEQAAWLYRKLAPPARELLDLLLEEPGKRFSGNEIAAQLRLENGAHGVAGILAWPGRYCRKLGRELPIATEGRDDGGTNYYLRPEVATLFAAAAGRPLSGAR